MKPLTIEQWGDCEYLRTKMLEVLGNSRKEFAILHRENEILLQRLAKLENSFAQAKLLKLLEVDDGKFQRLIEGAKK